MNSSRWCDFDILIPTISEQFRCGPTSDHGPYHWKRVEQNSLWLATETGADLLVVRLFAWFHDSKRENECTDPDHGRRGADYASSLRGKLFDLEDAAFDALIHACIWHTDADFSEDETIRACWDADRLDLLIFSFIPFPNFPNSLTNC